ncbi:MAG TPA: FKBP-type peptidyl-prolyl cis-trans isomerase [Marinilabiliaceae bacterium]|nr:FKBP-type peptidyl-prolyl cis-trans isomerase [Marinilabiliaceae bacterium]
MYFTHFLGQYRSRFKFWVPSDLAWGKKGTSNKIPPNAVLHFDIRLVSIK